MCDLGSRRTPKSGQLCAKPYQLMVMQVWESGILTHVYICPETTLVEVGVYKTDVWKSPRTAGVNLSRKGILYLRTEKEISDFVNLIIVDRINVWQSTIEVYWTTGGARRCCSAYSIEMPPRVIAASVAIMFDYWCNWWPAFTSDDSSRWEMKAAGRWAIPRGY